MVMVAATRSVDMKGLQHLALFSRRITLIFFQGGLPVFHQISFKITGPNSW
jgi:hypothetical protein